MLLRQEAVRELAAMVEFRQRVWATGKQINDFSFDRSALLKWLTEKPFIYRNKVYSLVRWITPAITLSMLGLCIYDWSYFPLLFMMAILQITIAGFHAKKIGEFQHVLSKAREVLKNYARLFELLAQQRVQSVLMKKHQAIAATAFETVKHFSVLVNALESRLVLLNAPLQELWALEPNVDASAYPLRTRAGPRPLMWRVALAAAVQSPWIGYGWNQVVHAFYDNAASQPASHTLPMHSHSLALDRVGRKKQAC